jgi:DNA (cytosine-5)-methyltransferase 1
MTAKASTLFNLEPLPHNENEALQWLLALVKAADNNSLQDTSLAEFKRGWYSIGYLYPGLHPDGALEHGSELSHDVDPYPEIANLEPRLLAPFFVNSGWPVVLAPVAAEARRRYEAEVLKDEEFYCSEAVIAGICHRSPELGEEVRREREKSHAGISSSLA